MAQFKSKNFIYNNIRFYEYGFYFCNVGGGLSSIIGSQRSVSNTNGFVQVDYSCPSFRLQIIKLDKENNILPLTDKDIRFLKVNLLLKQPAPLISEDNTGIVYYGIFKNITLNNTRTRGYLDVDFEMTEPHAYTSVRHFYVRNASSSNETRTNIMCEDEVDKYYPDFVIEVTENGSVTITNHTTNEEMVLNNLVKGEKIHVYGDRVFQMVNETAPEKNVYTNSNGKFISLKYGKNIISLKGYARVDIACQFRIGIETL